MLAAEHEEVFEEEEAAGPQNIHKLEVRRVTPSTDHSANGAIPLQTATLAPRPLHVDVTPAFPFHYICVLTHVPSVVLPSSDTVSVRGYQCRRLPETGRWGILHSRSRCLCTQEASDGSKGN